MDTTGETEAWGPRNARALDTLGAVALIIVLLFLLSQLLLAGRPLNFGFMANVFGTLARAALFTVILTTVSFLIGIAIGFPVGWARTLRTPSSSERAQGLTRSRVLDAGLLYPLRRVARRFSDFYVETVRGTPLLVQIIIIFTVVLVFAPTTWSLQLRSLVAGILALTINTGGYQGEIFRGGLQAVQRGQREAALAVGLTRRGTMRNVVMPQAFRLVIPPLTNEYIALFKASALLFIISVSWPIFGQTRELFGEARHLIDLSAQVFEIFVLLLFFYLIVTIPLSLLTRYLERRFQIAGLGIAPRGREGYIFRGRREYS